jgi:uncharacterized membrane protein
VIKRISLLVTAALLVATMAMAGLAAPAFASHGPNKEEHIKNQTPNADQGETGNTTTTFRKGNDNTETKYAGKSDPKIVSQCTNREVHQGTC